MTTPVALPQFTAAQYVEEAESPQSSTTGDPVAVVPLAILATFTPSVSQFQDPAGTPPFTVALDPILGRVDADGNLKAINSNPAYYLSGSTIYPCPTVNATSGLAVHAVFAGSFNPAYWVDILGNQTANPPGVPVWGIRLVSAALVPGLTYRVDYTGGDVPINSFRFAAPTDDEVVDLSVVSRISL